MSTIYLSVKWLYPPPNINSNKWYNIGVSLYKDCNVSRVVWNLIIQILTFLIIFNMGKKILHNGQNIQTKSILPIQIPVYENYAYEKKEEKKFLVNTIKFCLPVY